MGAFPIKRVGAAAAVVGRLVNAHMDPVANTSLRFLAGTQDPFSMVQLPTEVTTDDSGRFRIPLLGLHPKRGRGPLFLSTPLVHRGSQPEGERLAALFPEGPCHFGDQDLGDVLPEEAPVVAAGRVVDQDGQPVARATALLDRTVQAGCGPGPSLIPSDNDNPNTGQALEGPLGTGAA